jgi:hypothetical protein
LKINKFFIKKLRKKIKIKKINIKIEKSKAKRIKVHFLWGKKEKK